MLDTFGKSEFEDYWKIVLGVLTEKEITRTDFLNFQRGNQYEREALVYFNKEVKCNAKKCSYFSSAKNSVRPDGSVSSDLLIEMKTRGAARSPGPRERLRKNSSYFIQAQLQTLCTGTKYCITMPYPPESTSTNYLFVT